MLPRAVPGSVVVARQRRVGALAPASAAGPAIRLEPCRQELCHVPPASRALLLSARIPAFSRELFEQHLLFLWIRSQPVCYCYFGVGFLQIIRLLVMLTHTHCIGS